MKEVAIVIGGIILILVVGLFRPGTTANEVFDSDFAEDFIEHEIYPVDLNNLTTNISWNYKQHIEFYEDGSLGVQIDV